MQTAGTQNTTSHQRPLGSRVLKVVMNSLVSLGVLFIFQLPAMTVLRYFLFISFMPPKICVSKNMHREGSGEAQASPLA